MSNALAESLLQPWEGPAILLVDLDAFFASVEQLDHPGWRGKPVIVGGDADKHRGRLDGVLRSARLRCPQCPACIGCTAAVS